VRRIARAVLLAVAALAGARGMFAAEITSADLQIQGVGLKVVTVSATTGLEIPAQIQTEFGGKQNDAAPVVEGLLAAGELSGPGIDVPIHLETAPGHKFQIPGLSREGVYFLQNIRLMKDGEFLQSATPSVATITVSNLLQTSVKVRQLSIEEIRARGISIDARNFDVYEYTFSFIINGQTVEIPFPVIVDPRTHEVRKVPEEADYKLPPVSTILPPRWQPPDVETFELGEDGAGPQELPPSPTGGGGKRISIPAALVIPNNLAVLHQFFAVTLMVTNGAPAGSTVTLDSVNAVIKPPAPLRTVKSNPSVAFNQPVPIVDANTGVTFLVAQAKGEAEWTLEGLQPGTHTVEVEVRATYKSPGQADFPLKGTVKASIVVHDPRFNVNFSHPDTVREGIDYSTFSFITNMSAVTQNIRVTNGVPACSVSPGANICRLDETPEFHDLSIPAGEMRMIEYKLRPGVTGHVFATAGTVSDDNITASVQLHMGVSESGIPLSPATLIMPYYARYVSQPMVSSNLQILGLGYSLATAPLTPALAKHPHIIKTDVFQRATDIARAGQRVFLGEPMRDALAHMTLDLLGNSLELSEWDELRRVEKTGRSASASVARELEASLNGATVDDFVTRFAQVTAWREPYLLATTSAGNLAVRSVASNARAAVPSEAASGWVRQLPFAEVNQFLGGQLAIVGRFADSYEIEITPTADGPITLDVIFPANESASFLRGKVSFTGTSNQMVHLLVSRGMTSMNVRDLNGGIAGVGTLTSVTPEAIRIIGARQDLHLDPGGHKVSILWNRPVGVSGDLLAKLAAQVSLNRDGVSYQGPRPMSAAALQDPPRIANVTFDHSLSKNADYSMTVAPLVDPLNNAGVSFPNAIVPVIDNDAPGGILFGHVLKGDNSPIANAEVRLYLEQDAGPPQYDASRSSDGAFLFEFVPRDIDNKQPGTYMLQAVTLDGKETTVNGAVRLPGRVHFVNLVFLGRGSAEGIVRYNNGEVVPGANVVVGSTMFDQFRSATADANGRYSIGDLPVGPLTFSATDNDGNVTFAASEIKTAGQLLVQDLSIFRQPFPGVATIRGVVKRSDTNALVSGAHVGVYTQGYGLVDGFTDSTGRFEFTKVPAGFVTVLASEWSISREATSLDFDLSKDETRDLVLTLNVKPAEEFVTVEGDVTREDPLFPGDSSKYQRVAGALVKIEKAQAVTADANGHFIFTGVPLSFAGKNVQAYDPITTRSATVVMPQLNANAANLLPIFISTANGYGKGTVRVRLLNAAGSPVSGFRVIEPGFPPLGPTELESKGNGVYEMKDVPVGAFKTIWAIGNGSPPYGDQTATGTVKVEFNGHVAAMNLRLPGQGTVRTKLVADIDVIGDVDITYPAWDEADQMMSPKTIRKSTSENGVPGYATFSAVPALQNFTVASAHPVYGYASSSTRLGFDGDVQSITLQLNKLSTVRGVVYAVDGRTPVPGAAVRIEDGRQNQGVFTTQPDGSFVFFNEPAGIGFRVIAEITQSGVYRTGVASGVTPSAGGPVNNVSVIMRTQGAIDGRIVYAGFKVFDPQNSANNVPDNTPNDLSDNAPVPLAKFVLRELDFPSRSFGTTADPLSADVAGRFTINNVFTGAVRVSASDPGNQETRGVWTGTIAQEGERVTAYVAIGSEGFGPVTVRVFDPNNQNAPVLNAEVSLVKGVFPFNLFDLATTDGDGTVRFDQVPAGPYKVSAYSKSLGKSGNSAIFNVVPITGASVDVVLEFSGRVDGKLSDPEANNAGVPGAPVTLTAAQFQTRASSDAAGVFVFLGVREGTFTLEAKDTQSNRRAFAQRNLSQADPNPFVSLQLEPTEPLNVSVYLPNDTGGNSNILAPIVNLEVRQRNDDFFRALQGNNFVMQGVLENETYSIYVKEVGGDGREIRTANHFPVGSASNPLKLVLPAYGTAEVHVVQAGAPAANAKVTVSGGGKSVSVYTDASGVAFARGIPLGTASVQAVSVDNAFSGSASITIASQSTNAVVTITLGAFAGVTGLVEAELGGPSVGTRVVASFSGRVLEVFTDSTGRYTFQGIPTSTAVQLTYVGPDDVTVGARQTVNITAADASKVIVAATVKLDATPPQVATIIPADGSQNVSPDSPVSIVFTEAIQAAYVNSSYIQLLPADSTTPVATSYSTIANADGTFTVKLTPPAPPAGQQFPLKSNTLYRIIVSSEVRDLTGNKIPAARGASFITSDYAEPKVLKVTPATTTALQPATTFEFRFNEPIDPAPWATGGTGQFHFYKISTAGPSGTILAEKPGRAYVDPASGLSLFFAPNDPIEAESFYRVVFSGVRDLQGNTLGTQTFHFFSYDLVKPFTTIVSPVPGGFPLISGVEYIAGVDIRNGSASGTTATDVAKVDWFRVDGATVTYLTTSTAAPFTYRFVAPDAPPAGSTLTLRAVATDLSLNEGDPGSFTWDVKPNQAPQNVTVTLTPSDSIYPGNHALAAVTFTDEGTFAAVQIDAAATNADGSAYASSQVKQLTRTKVDDPWPAANFDFDLPATLKQGTNATFTANVTDVRGLKGTGTKTLSLSVDTIAPDLTNLAPASQTRYHIGDKFTISAVVKDFETGIAEVVFAYDGKTIKVTPPSALLVKTATGTWTVQSGQITVPAKNVDTNIPIVVTVKDFGGNTFSKSTEVVYIGVNDPSVPKGAWLCPIDSATYPAAQTLSVKLQARATDDISVTGVKFTVPGVTDPIAATRVGTTDVYEATTNITTPAAGETFTLTATISDADPTHDLAIPITLTAVAVDITVDNRVQAITSADVATYNGKSIYVRGASARLVPHVPLTLKNLIVLDGGRVETLSTTTTVEQKLDVTVTDRLFVDCASSVDVTGRGYLGGWGANSDGSNTKNEDNRGRTNGNTATGGPTPGAAASYGGLGGERNGGVTNAVYGSITNPSELGTGGAGNATCCSAGSSGGGAIKLRGGIFAVAGAIRADGGSGINPAIDPGSGGSVNIQSSQLIAGPSARITANGGDDESAFNVSRGGGGGRIAIAATDRFDVETVGLQIQAHGGRHTAAELAAFLDGGAGTVYLRRPGATDGELFAGSYDERFPTSVHLTRPTPISGTLQFDRVTVGARALLRADANLTIGGVLNQKSAATIDPTGVLILNGEVPVLTATTTPASGSSLIQASSFTLNYTATSAAGIGAVTYAFSPLTASVTDSWFSYPVSASPSPLTSINVPFDAAAGPATLTLNTTDRAGRGITLAPLTYTIVANAAPVVDKFDVVPAALSIYPGQTVTATISLHDDLKLTKWTFTSTIGTGTPTVSTFFPNVPSVTDQVISIPVAIDTPGGQPLKLDLVAEDAFPNRAATAVTKTVNILRDTNPPSVTIVSPLNNALYNEGTGNTIQVRATITDAEVAVKEAYVQVEGTAQVALAKSGNDYTATIPVPSVDGTDIVNKSLTIIAKDYEGNSATPSVNLRIQPINDPNAPVINWVCATTGAMYPAGYGVHLRVFALGNNNGNSANGIQKIEMFVDGSTTPLTATAVSGVANNFEVIYTIPAAAVAGSVISVRAVATNQSGLSEGVSTSFAVVAGTKITTDTTIAANNTTFENQTLIIQSGTTTIVGQHTFDKLIVLDNAKVTHVATDTTTVQRLTFTATSNVFVSCLGTIDASGRGITGNSGSTAYTYDPVTDKPTLTGGATSFTAGSHAGFGGSATGTQAPATWGSPFDPNTPGGVGITTTASYAGGGVVRFTTQTLHVDGKILASGVGGNSAGGGGSIRIDAQTITGVGEIRADGADGPNTGSGGGGRIAIRYRTLSTPTPKISASSGTAVSGPPGGAGTIYLRQLDASNAKISDELLLDNTNRVAPTATPIATAGSGTVSSVSGNTVTLSNAVPLDVEGTWIEFLDANGKVASANEITARTATSVTLAGTVSVANGAAYRGTIYADKLTSRNGAFAGASSSRIPLYIGTANSGFRFGNVVVNGDVSLQTANMEVNGTIAATNLSLTSSNLGHSIATATTINRLNVDVAQTLTVDAASAIDVTARGLTGAVSGVPYTYDKLLNKPVLATGVNQSIGGSHGGQGGSGLSVVPSAYGSLFDPNEPGSAAGSGFTTCMPCRAGGGVARIHAATIQLDGKILANGEASNPSGAGGSVRIDASTIAGAGEIRADGGININGASGGGGRVAIYYDTLSIPSTKISAAALQSSSITGAGAPGTVYLKRNADADGDLTVDNLGRTTNRFTPLTAVGYATITDFGSDFVKDASAQFLAPDQLRGVRTVVNYDRTKSWPVTSNDDKTLRLDVSNTPLAAQNGQPLRGLYRFKSVKLRNANLDTIDLFESAAPIDKDAPSTIIGNNQAPPLLNAALIALQAVPTGSAIMATAGGVTDPDTPIVLTATNTRTGNNFTTTAAADGSFTIPVTGNQGDTITLKARDANTYPLESPVLIVGTLATTTPVPTQVNKTDWTTDTNFLPRTLSRDGAYLAAASLPTSNGFSDKLVILGIADPAHPNFIRTATSGAGSVRDVVVSNGFAFVAADRFYTLDLSNPTATNNFPGDFFGSDNAVAVGGGYAFTAEVNNNNDGRINIFDVQNPASPRALRQQAIAGFGGYAFTDLLTYGNDYIIGISNWKPSGVGHDVMIIDRRDVNALKKVAELEIPNFDAFRGTIVGSYLYLISAQAKAVVVDLTNPLAPVVSGSVNLPAAANGVAIVGRDGFLADGTSGLVTLDVTNPATPTMTGATAISGNSWDVSLVGAYAYVANETGIALVPAQIAPQIALSRISLSLAGTTVTVSGLPQSVTGNAPIKVDIVNTTSGVSVNNLTVNADGSFTASLAAAPGNGMTIKATDSFGRITGPLSLGTVPFGSATHSLTITQAMSDSAFFPRVIATGGDWLAVSSYPTDNGFSDKIVLYDITDRANPVYKRTIASGAGNVRDLSIVNGWLLIAADRLSTLQLSNPASTPIFPGDFFGSDNAITVVDGLAFTAEVNNNNDGRINIYDVSTPSTPRALGQKAVAGFGGYTFTALAPLGSRYLVGVSNWKPSGVGHDLMVIDRRDVQNLKKLSEIDIPNFDAFHVTVVGNYAYLTGVGGGLATVDLTNPLVPSIVGVVKTPGYPRRTDALGSILAVADASAGATFVDISPALPTILGNQGTGGDAWDIAFNAATIYVAHDTGISVIDNLGTPPLIDRSLITIVAASGGTMATVSGAAKSILGVAPLTYEVRNATSGAAISGLAVAADGSFSQMITAVPGDAITIKATDSANRSAGPFPIGTVPFGSASTSLTITQAMTDSNFFARNIATSGNWLAVASYPSNNGSSDKIVLYDITSRANPVYKRTVASGSGSVRDLAIANGWLLIATDRLSLLNLNDPNSTPVFPGDFFGSDNAVVYVDGYAFTAEVNNNNDGRINIYDVSTPTTPRALRQQAIAGFGGYAFTGLALLGTDYLVGVSNFKPSGVGHDVMVIDRRDVSSLKKIADFDIPNFDAFRVTVVGTNAYIAGASGGLAVVNLSNPASPQLTGILSTPGYPLGVEAFGATLAVADASAGATFVDISPVGMPTIIGNQPTGGSAWDCTFNGSTLYVANETGIALIDNLGTPPLIDRPLITITSNGASTATVTGAVKSILGFGTLTVELRNVRTGQTVGNIAVATDGSFTSTITGVSGDTLTVKATDSVGRVSGPLSIGTVPFGSASTSITITQAMSDSSFFARLVAADGNHLAVASYPTDTSSDKILLFDVTTPGFPVYKRTVATGAGIVRDLEIRNGWLYFAADRVGALNLDVANSTPVFPGDFFGSDNALCLAGGYVYSAEVNNNNDGRINIYDFSTPSAPRALRQQALAGFGGYAFTGLVSLGDNYLVGISNFKPSGVGHDLMILDRRDQNNLAKVAEFDIPNFDAFRGTIVGNLLYVTGLGGGTAIVDLTNPLAPVVLNVIPAAPARHAEVAGSTLAIASGSNGITFVDVSNPSSPQTIASQAVPGSAWDVAFSRGAMYVATELNLTAIANVGVPPIFNERLVTITPAATATTVQGAASSLTGIAPITVALRNTSTGVTSTPVTVAADGSWTATVAAIPGASLSVIATDVTGRTTTRTLPTTYGVTTTYIANPTTAANDTNYRSRRVSSDGTTTAVTTGSLFGNSTPRADRLLLYKSATPNDPPVVNGSGYGGITDLVINGGYMYVAGDRFATVNLADPNLTKNFTSDPFGADASIVVSNGFAFTGEMNNNNDGRINIYNVSNPGAPSFVRQQAMAGVGGLIYRALAAFGTSYLIAISPDRPSGVDHDVTVIDRTNVNALVKVTEVPIANFDALDAVVDGNTLYVAGGDGGVAIIDLTNPFAPAIKSILNTPGIARGIALAGTNQIVVADGGGPGVTFIDVTSKTAPFIIGSQALPGNITDVDVVGNTVYVAGENYYHTIVRP
jgi:hypothetical protein